MTTVVMCHCPGISTRKCKNVMSHSYVYRSQRHTVYTHRHVSCIYVSMRALVRGVWCIVVMVTVSIYLMSHLHENTEHYYNERKHPTWLPMALTAVI